MTIPFRLAALAAAALTAASLTASVYAADGGAAAAAAPAAAAPAPKSPLDFTMNDIDGKPVDLSTFKGKVVMIVNTASKCGFTPQYKSLEALYEKYKDKGLVILAFPANDFGHQEPGTDTEIKQFCSLRYQTTFNLFSKIVVKGDGQSPLYAFLTKKDTDPKFSGPITWNFNKFLVDRQGNLVARFPSPVDPMAAAVTVAVESALDQN